MRAEVWCEPVIHGTALSEIHITARVIEPSAYTGQPTAGFEDVAFFWMDGTPLPDVLCKLIPADAYEDALAEAAQDVWEGRRR